MILYVGILGKEWNHFLWYYFIVATFYVFEISNMSDTKMVRWSATNQLVVSWLLNACEPTIATIMMFIASVK